MGDHAALQTLSGSNADRSDTLAVMCLDGGFEPYGNIRSR